jgi:hypothetical protein
LNPGAKVEAADVNLWTVWAKESKSGGESRRRSTAPHDFRKVGCGSPNPLLAAMATELRTMEKAFSQCFGRVMSDLAYALRQIFREKAFG